MVNLEETKKHIKKEIKKIMDEKRIAKDQLALDAGVSTTTISDILSCKYDITVNKLLAICEALGVYYGEILPILSCVDKQNVRLWEIKQEYMSVASDSRERVLNIVLAVLEVSVTAYLSRGSDDSDSKEKEKKKENIPVSTEQYIAKQIERILEYKGIKRNKLAENAGIASNTLANVLSGKVNMKVSTLLGICEALEVFPEELLPQPTWTNKREYGFASIRQKLVSVPSEWRKKEIEAVKAILIAWRESH